MILSQPNRIIWEYFHCLRRSVKRAEKARNESERKQEAALSILMAVTIVEAFLNIFFRILVSQKQYSKYQDRILRDLKDRRSLGYKIKAWPKDVLGKQLDFSQGIPKLFNDLKERRNALMHFTSTHQTLVFQDSRIEGFTDSSNYDSLGIQDAILALQVAEGMISEMLVLKPIPEGDIHEALNFWIGMMQ
jgi:hypothetical protein